MKKYLNISILILSLFLFESILNAQVKITPRIILDLEGTINAPVPGVIREADVDPSASVGLEIEKKFSKVFSLGWGIQFVPKRKLDIENEGSFGFVPLYLCTLINLSESDAIKPGISLNIGYNITHYGDYNIGDKVDLEGGMYFGIGGRLTFGDFIFLEGMYRNFGGSLKHKSTEIGMEYSTFSVGFGFSM